MYQNILELGVSQGEYNLAQDPLTIARTLVALEDAYGLPLIAKTTIDNVAAFTAAYEPGAGAAAKCWPGDGRVRRDRHLYPLGTLEQRSKLGFAERSSVHRPHGQLSLFSTPRGKAPPSSDKST
jgi:hypothetical protein